VGGLDELVGLGDRARVPRNGFVDVRIPADRKEAAHGHGWDDHPNLSDELHRALAEFDRVTRDALFALADHEPLYDVARRHGMSYPAVRQRVSRARRALRPELAGYRRVAN
jgi:DNA-directed RNA polymerase specialized sigma24 family protein